MGFPHAAAACALMPGGRFFCDHYAPGRSGATSHRVSQFGRSTPGLKCMLAPPSPPRRIPMPRHVNTNAWLLAGWLAVTLMSVGPAPAQSPDAMAAAKELMT